MSSESNTTELVLPAGERCTLRPVSADDEPLLLKIYASTREEELSQVEWAEGHKEQFLLWQLTMQRAEYEQRFPNASYQIIEVDGEAAGRFWTGEDKEQIRLLDIAILPQFQNRGVGTTLLRYLMDEATRSQKLLRHMVYVLNNDGQRFYDRLGFVVTEDSGAYRQMEWRPPTKA